MIVIDIVKVIVPAALAFFIGIAITPIITHYLYKYKVWKKAGGKTALDGTKAVEFTKLREDVETKTPRMGGIVIWGSVLFTILFLWILSLTSNNDTFNKLDFLSRSQTWIPLFTLLVGAFVGFINDVLDVTSSSGERGISLKVRLIVVGTVSLFIGWWFFEKLGIVSIAIPFDGDLFIGWLIIPLFMLVSLALYASGVIDGIDGLSGGVFASIFAAYAGIAFYQQQIDLAAFNATVVGALLAFLWFNIPPARFWMTETGTMGLTMTIAVVAFMTDTLGGGEGIAVLPIIAILLVITVISNIVQVLSKKFRGKKVFKVAPLHHHFEAIGWPGYKVTMRYWVVSVVFAVIGIIIALIG
ncbi:MAG TPA: hypothetical protein ENI63_00150 [Candidatus Kaiserbacteria bacterium]|nr:hypothetical protein [Candidatus Kaiserbacteria bacterium]